MIEVFFFAVAKQTIGKLLQPMRPKHAEEESDSDNDNEDDECVQRCDSVLVKPIGHWNWESKSIILPRRRLQ